MPAVKVKENEPFDVALRRFKRSCEKAGVLAEVRSREFYEKPTAERKRKAAAATPECPVCAGHCFFRNSASPRVNSGVFCFLSAHPGSILSVYGRPDPAILHR